MFFLRLGTTAFGGPAAHIAIMEDELVRRRRWLSREKFLDLLGASSLIPGPSSSELAILVGSLRAGWVGLLVAGSCFILPAAIIVAALAWVYVHFGALPAVSAILYAVKPVVIAIVVQAIWGLGRTAVKTKLLSDDRDSWSCCSVHQFASSVVASVRGDGRLPDGSRREEGGIYFFSGDDGNRGRRSGLF